MPPPDGAGVAGYPPPLPTAGHTAPVPRRIRAMLAGRTVLDTDGAVYVWEWPRYPQYYIPVGDIDGDCLVDEHHEQRLSRGTARRFALRVGEVHRPAAVRCYAADADPTVAGRARFEWDALDAWFEEDEQVFVHPRDPYVRVDALRSNRRVEVARDGVLLAASSSPVLVFETGLPTRYYLDPTDVDLTRLVPSATRTSCPYKGTTTAYWDVVVDGRTHPDLAWSYGFPTRGLHPVAGLIAFYNEKVDITLDGRRLARPVTHFS
jgi:uncharacterized protein (DUF427 family)